MKRYQPETADEVAKLIASASAPLEILGNGTKAGIANACSAEDTLSLSGLSGINFYEPSELAISVQAGTPLSVINAALAEANQRLAFEPPTYGELLGNVDADPTAGGLVATNLSGPPRVSRGALRDHLLGVEFVNGRGQQIKSGGRVMKNVTGYDLCKLLAGSWGTLGALTNVTLKTLPRMEAESTLLMSCNDIQAAGRLMRQAMITPFDVVSAAYIRGVVAIRIEGLKQSVDYRFAELQDDLPDGDLGERQRRLDDAQSIAYWQAAAEVEQGLDNSERVWKISVAPTDGPAIVEALIADDQDRDEDDKRSYMLDWSGGLVWVGESLGTATNLLEIIAPWMQDGKRGHATLIRGKGNPSRTPLSPAQQTLATKIKLAFDPAGVLSPARF